MKKLSITLMLLTIVGLSTSFAQNLTKPKKGNAIRLKDYTLTVKQGQEVNIDMWVVKAKKYKLNLGAPKAKGKDGVDFWFNAKSEDPITFGVKIKVDESTPVGDHMYVLNVDGIGRNAVKGATILLKVVSAEQE
ncbi:hypothetical protein [Roseivirga misakiensis]|uniref:Uncharacterized protein n=1 Tax=Roseivirga misakiensis TaxID=1563681 RepID=A0A1E5T4S2_9BACT|nr:hypothetical protein [Roseivirga misakiensis]OEK06351.1 hypothetical protein BFP71_01350 [Roseivirga misakiensis]